VHGPAGREIHFQNIAYNIYFQVTDVHITRKKVVKKSGDSNFWAGLMNVKDLMLKHGKFKVNSGKETSYGNDLWIGQEQH
jgi:hypothetical protein